MAASGESLAFQRRRNRETALLTRLVASLRQIGVPLAQIKVVLSLDASEAAAQVAASWTGTEAQHGAHREMANYLVDRLSGKRPAIHEIAVRDIPTGDPSAHRGPDCDFAVALR